MASIFPQLPQGTIWPLQITQAYAILLQSHMRAVRLLQSEDGEPVQLQLNAQTIKDQVIPLLRALEPAMPNNIDWVAECTVKMMDVITDLQLMAAELDVRYVLCLIFSYRNTAQMLPELPPESLMLSQYTLTIQGDLEDPRSPSNHNG